MGIQGSKCKIFLDLRQKVGKQNIITDTLWYLNKMDKLRFLTSLRFWALVAIAVVKLLEAEGTLATDVSNAIVVVLGGFTVVRTVDKFIPQV